MAHYIKNWADFLKQKPLKMKVFYLACIGRLILSTSIERAEKLLVMLFICSLSETDGFLVSDPGKKTRCQNAKDQLKLLITDEIPEYENLLTQIESEEEEEGDSENSQYSESENDKLLSKKKKIENITEWQEWAISKRDYALTLIQEGEHDNAHLDVKFAQKLIEEVRHIPMWTNIYNYKFDFSHIRPSSSASVECEIKKNKKIRIAK